MCALSLAATAQAVGAEPPMETVAAWMTGSFSSAEQSAHDEAFYDIRLEMVPIWTDRDDALWIYVEQAAASALERPYRQRIYRVTEDPSGAIRSEVFSLPEPLEFAGAWREPERLDALTPESLTVRQGCAVVLHRQPSGLYAGKTDDRAVSELAARRELRDVGGHGRP